VSYLTDAEKHQIAPDSSQHAKQVWYKKRKKVLEKTTDVADKDVLREILFVLLKIYFELKKPK